MTRKKSRPTHRENAAAVPSNEGGFYKMFWNSMDDPGTNRPNSPSQSVTSPVIIVDDSPSGSPCEVDENSCDNLVIPRPIKEEIVENAVENCHEPSTETHPGNLQDSFSKVNGDSSHQTCLPGNHLTSPSKNSFSPSHQTHLIFLENSTQIKNSPLRGGSSKMTPFSSCAYGNASSNEPSSEIPISLDSPQETPRSEEDGDSVQLVEDNQVRDLVTSEEHLEIPESNIRTTKDSNPEEMLSKTDVNLNSHSCVKTSGDSLVSHEGFLLASTGGEQVLVEAPICSREIPTEADMVFSEELPSNTNGESAEETPMDVVSVPHSPSFRPICHEGTPLDGPPTDGISDNQFSTVSSNVNIEENTDALSKEGLDLEGSLSLLQKLLNAPDEEINDAVNQVPGLTDLIGGQVDPEVQDVGQMDESESTQGSAFLSNVDISSMDKDYSTSLAGNILPAGGNVPADGSHKNQSNEMVVDEEEEFPTFSANFLPKKIKLDSIGILRSVKFLKEQVRALYKEYLNDDVVLRTVREPQPPIEEESEPADEVEEESCPSVNIPYPMCFVKVERLPEPFVERSTVAMSDDTFKTWKKEIIRQKNEEKFRHLKVWRRGRTLLWRECELAGMDRITYDEQVAYVKKHKLKENSSSDSESSSGDESGHDASLLHNDSPEGSSSEDDGVSCEDDEVSSVDLSSSPLKLNNSETRSISSPHSEPETPSNILSPEEEYIVERANKSSTTATPSALKITIRKASFSKSEEDKEKPDGEENFSVPSYPAVHKPRKVATKRTFRRPSDPIHKVSVAPKSAGADSKKSKTAPVEDIDLYDQSLLGRRSYEVENFNLLEKWDIPFEEPTLFRSPRAASRLAQLKTKEAFAPTLKRHAPPKTTTGSNALVSKEVKDVVEMLCSKTVEAMLFPESKLTSPKKLTKVNVNKPADTRSPATCSQPNELPPKLLLPSDEATSNLDESADMSHSETSSTLGASSDFGGSTTSLLSEDLALPKIKTPPKARRRRRTGPAWNKKKKVKGKANTEGPVVHESSKRDEHPAENNLNLISQSKEPVVEKVSPESENSIQGVRASPAHSTQVPVVSEGPGQSPHESEDDSAYRTKDHVIANESNRMETEPSEKNKPADLKMSENLPEEAHLKKREQQEIVPPRLTRSKQPTVDLDPELLETFGARKRKPKTELLGNGSQDVDSKKPKQPDIKKMPLRSRELSSKPSAKVFEEASSKIDEVMDDDSNTQVPEVSEGPGEATALDTEEKQDQEKKVDAEKPPGRMLRSRSRVPPPTKNTTASSQDRSGANLKTDKLSQVGEEKTVGKNKLEEPVVLESPQSPPPETVEPEPLMNSRITRSKKRRSGPAYVAVKSTGESPLPSVCDIVDSIAGQRLPLSKLFDAPSSLPSLATEPVLSCRALTSSDDSVHAADGKEETGSSSELSIPQLSVVQKESQDVEPNKVTTLSDVGSADEPSGKSVEEMLVSFPDQTSQLSNKSPVEPSPCPPVEENQSSAAVDLHAETLDGNSISSEAANTNSELILEKPSPEKVGSVTRGASLEVLNIVNSMKQSLAATSPTKVCTPVSTVSPPLSGDHLETAPLDMLTPRQPSVSNIPTCPAVSTSSLPAFPNSTQDICSILPGTFLNSLFNSSLDASLATYSNEVNDPSLTDDPGDLVIDESANDLDVNFFDNLTNADLSKADDDDNDFSDDENNTDLADKIDKIVKDQIYQDPVPVPSLKPKETGANAKDCKKSQEETSSDKGASSLNRRDSIDERTGLPNNLIQRLRDPRIRSRLLSHLEEVETNEKTPQSSIAALLNIIPSSDVTSSTAEGPADPHSDPRKKIDGATVTAVSCPSVSSSVDSCSSTHVPAVPPSPTLPIVAMQLETTVSTGIAGLPLEKFSTPVLTTPLIQSGTPSQQPLVTQGTPILSAENFDKAEGPPDLSKVEFLVPPSDEEDEEECIKRRPKKAKKEVDVELMYKSPLEDLQSEARPAYGERVPRRYSENFPRRRSDERRPRWDDRRSRHDEVRDNRPSRDRSRDRRFEDRGRDRSRDRRGYYDRPPRDQSRDRRAHDPYIESPHQVPYHPPSSPWPVGDPAFNHHQGMMIQHPETHHWQQNYCVEPNFPPHPPLFGPEPPKIDYMETRLINLELLPKTTNLHVPPDKKVYDYFNKENVQMLQTPPPTYDPKDEPQPLRVLDPVTDEMVEIIPLPRPTSGLTKDFFRHVPPDLTLDDVVKFHFISPAYVMVRDNEEDLESSSDEDNGLSIKNNEKSKLIHRNEENKTAVEHKKRQSKPLEQKGGSKLSLENLQQKDNEPEWGVPADSKKESVSGNLFKQQSSNEAPLKNDPLQKILSNLPILREQYSQQKSQPPVEPTPPPPPEWNDVDLRVSRVVPENEELPGSNPSPPRKKSKHRSRSRSRSPRRRRRSRSRSPSLRSDLSVSPPSSRSRSPSYSRRGSTSSRRRRSRSRSSERSRSRRSSPRRHSTSISPSRKHSRR